MIGINREHEYYGTLRNPLNVCHFAHRLLIYAFVLLAFVPSVGADSSKVTQKMEIAELVEAARKGEQPIIEIQDIQVPLALIESSDRNTSSLLVMQHEVTQELYERLMGTNPSHFTGRLRPVENMRYDEVLEFIRRFNAKTNIFSELPSTEDWERIRQKAFPDSSVDILGYSWLEENSNYTTHQVATKKADSAGLFDLYGNVSEFLLDEGKTFEFIGVRTRVRPLAGGAFNTQNHQLNLGRMISHEPVKNGTRSVVTGFRLIIRIDQVEMEKDMNGDTP